MRHRAWRLITLQCVVILSFNHCVSAFDGVVNNAGNISLSESDSALLTNIDGADNEILLGAKDDSSASYSVIGEEQFHQYLDNRGNDTNNSTMKTSHEIDRNNTSEKEHEDKDQSHQYLDNRRYDTKNSTFKVSHLEEVDGNNKLDSTNEHEDEGLLKSLIKFTSGTLFRMFYASDSSENNEMKDAPLEDEHSSVETNNNSGSRIVQKINEETRSKSHVNSNKNYESRGLSTELDVLNEIDPNTDVNSVESDGKVHHARSEKNQDGGVNKEANRVPIDSTSVGNSGVGDKYAWTKIRTDILGDLFPNDDPNAQYHADGELEDDNVWNELIKSGREVEVPGSETVHVKLRDEATGKPEDFVEGEEKAMEEVEEGIRNLDFEEKVLHLENEGGVALEAKVTKDSELVAGRSPQVIEIKGNNKFENSSEKWGGRIILEEVSNEPQVASHNHDQSNKSVEVDFQVMSATPVPTVSSVQEDATLKTSSETSTEISNPAAAVNTSEINDSSVIKPLSDAVQEVVTSKTLSEVTTEISNPAASVNASKRTDSSEIRPINDAPQDEAQGSETLEEEDSGVSLAFVFDATGSMWDDLVQVREGAAKILNAMLERPDKPIYNYVLVPFQDPNIGPVTVTTDHAYLMQQLNAIQVFGGSDCPEMSIHAVKLALETSRPLSYIYVFTDASAKDYALVDEVLPLVQEKLSKVVFVMTGDCGNPKHPGYLVYHKIAATSSGQVYHLNKTDVNEVLNFIRLTLKPQKEKVNLLSVDHVGEINVNDSNIPLTVDKSLSEFTVSLSGRNASLGVFDPSGVAAVPPKLTPLLNLENVKVVNIKEPDPGIWTLKVDVDSDSQFTVRTTGLSSSDFGYGFSQQPDINPAYTVARPFKGSDTNLFIWMTEQPEELSDFKSVELTGINGKVFQILPLEPIEKYIGVYKTKPFTPPEDFFYIHVHGITSDGHPFRRISPTAVSPAKEEKPEIVVSSNEVVVFANGNAVLSGFVKSYLPFKVDWHKNGVRLGPEQHFTFSSNVTHELRNISKNDQGVYIIRAINNIGRSFKTLKVTVKGGIPVVVAGSPRGHGDVTVWDEVTMGCVVSSDLPYTVTWLKQSNSSGTDHAVEDVKIPSLTDSKEKRIGVLQNNTLFIAHALLEDSGTYVCNAETSVGVGKSRFQLSVHEEPKVEILPKNIDVSAGEQVTLTCKALSGHPKLTWTRNGTLMHGTNSRWRIVDGKNQSELVLNGVQKTDEGIYKCEAENEVGEDVSETRIQVHEVPKIIVDKERKVIIDGPTEIVLKCHAYNVPEDYELLWIPGILTDDTNLSEIFNEQHSSPKYNTSTKGYLSIRNVERSDQGWYTCLAKSKGGISKDETFLKVEEVPKLTVIPNLVQFEEGEDIYVQCFLDAGLPVPNIMWFKDGRALIAQYYHIKIERTNDTLLKLQIENAQVKDAGRYECRAINDVGFGQAFSDVNVIKTPTAVALEKSLLVKEGDPATLTCMISGKPHPGVKWYKDSQEILQNSIEVSEYATNQNSLQLASVDKSTAGIYKCKAENPFGLAEDYIKLEVGSNPIISSISNNTDIDIEADGLLYCVVVAYPEPKITWFRKDYRPLDSERFMPSTTGELLITNARKEDEGIYTCVGDNIYGSVTSEVAVKITGIVQPLLKKTQEQEENSKEIKKFLLGERVEMPCVISQGRPFPEKKWYFNEHPLQAFNHSSALSISDDGTLVLNNLLPNQTGIYECTASNLAGVDRIRIELELFRQPLILGDMPTEVRGLLGENVEIPCTAIGDPAPVLSWERPGYHQLPFGSFISDKRSQSTENGDESFPRTGETYGGLVIVNTTLDDEGTYVCIAGNIVGSARRATAMQVMVPPKITSVSEDVSVIEGQVVELFCDVEGRPTPSVSWLKDNTPLKFHHAFNSKSIRFTSAANDEGKYTCVASSSVGSDMKNTTLSVLVPPIINNGGEEKVEVVEGDSTEIQCSATGVPKPTISWQWKGLQNSSDSIEDDHFSDNGDKLKIKNVTKELAGLYICDAENLAGITQKVFRLDVLVPPRILEDFPVNVSLAEGDDFSMPCTASGQPTPAIFWQRGVVLLRSGHQDGNKFVMQDNTLVLTAVTLESSGIYSCIASNIAGSASRNYSIEVYVAPVVVDSSETRVEVMETMTGKLTCPVAAASIMWLKNGTVLDFKANERADDVHFKTADDGRSLEIVEASSVDSGEYTCVATNPAGTSQVKFLVDVIVHPFFHNEYAATVIKVQQGEPVLLNCSVGGNPKPKMSWRRLEGNLPVTEHTVPGVIFDKTKESIRIPAAEYHHAGKYHCWAFNKLDRIDRTFKITVSGPPEIDGQSEESLEIINGDTVSLACSITGVPEPEFSWIFTTRRLNNVTLKETSNQLLLTNFNLEDAGLYYCKATNMAGVKYKIFNVSVIEPPTIEGSEFRENIKVRSNESLKLSCVTRGMPQPSVAWLRNGHIIKAGPNMLTANNTHTVTLPALSGKYSCVSSNKAGMAEKHFLVKILVAPRWAKQVEKLTSGDALTPVVGFPLNIKCPVTGNPPPDISWLKDGQPLMEGDSIYYAESEVTHSGNYTCYAVNHAGNFTKTFQVDVLVPPRFRDGSETRRLKLKPNMTAILNCSSEGNPNPNVMWLRGLNPITPQNSSQEILELQSVTGADSGDYLCISSNLAGESEKSFTVEVQEAPAVDDVSSLSVPNLLVKLHHRVTIKCPLAGSPSPNITWFKNGEKISRGSDNNFEISPDERELQIIHAITSDAGEYQCVAQNQAGLKELSFELSVVVPLEWGDWSQWEECSSSCGGGEQKRERSCGQGKNIDLLSQMKLVILDKSSCLGDAVQTRKCNQFPCLTEGNWSEWSLWSDCSASCGQSSRKRSRVCETQETDIPCSGPDSEYKTCQVPSCSFWGPWSDWSECSASCNHGTKSRKRQCVGAPGSCEGGDQEETTCNTHRCPVNGKWSSWGEWGECSVTCGRGVRQRARICYRPRFGGQPCAGDNLQIEKCRLRSCHNRASTPKLANLRVSGRLNGEDLEETNLVAKVGHYRGKRVVTATVNDILKQQAGWFPYLTFLMPPVQWNTAYEEGSADNGYSLTNGNFDQESRYQFATGHELVIDAKGRGIDPDNGTLQVDIEVIGNIPMAQPKASVVIEPFTEDFVQTGPNKLFSSSESSVDVDGKQIPFFWNKTVSYDTELGTMPYPVERLATDDILSDYDSDSQRLFYSASNSISSPYGREKCPKGFKLDQRYQHCRDIDECKSKRTNDCHPTQTCENLFGTYRCVCAQGFRPTANGRRCQDINECEENLHDCSHTCVNTIGGYRCTCPLGMILSHDTLNCKEDSYNYDSDFAADWGNEDSYQTHAETLQHNRRNLNYDNEYDSSLLALDQVREEWLCPPGQIREDNRCVEEKGKGNVHCSFEKCGEHETCLPTVNGYRCVETRCPLLYQQDIHTRKCFAVCSKSRCEKGAKEWEEITFVPLPLESASVQQYQDLLELSTEDESSNMIYTVAENEFNLPLRVRIENNAGILYSMRYFDFEGVNKVVIQATTYEEHTSTALSIYTFVVFVYDPSQI